MTRRDFQDRASTGAGLVLSLMFHLALLYGAFYWANLQSSGGSSLGMGDGQEILFQLAKGDGENEDAALAESDEPAQEPETEPVEEAEEETPIEDPQPESTLEELEEDTEELTEEIVEEQPDETAEQASKEVPEIVESALTVEKVVEDEVAEQTLASASAARSESKPTAIGGVTAPSEGGGGDAAKSSQNRKGSDMSGQQVGDAFVGRRLHLTMGRIDLDGGNKLNDVTIDIYPDGTSRVRLTYHHEQYFERIRQVDRELKSAGEWWIEGNSFCHRAKAIDYGTTDCFDMTEDEQGDFRMYYRKCTARSSMYCKTGRIAGKGKVGGDAQ